MYKLPSLFCVAALVIIGAPTGSQAQIVVDHSFGAGGALNATNGNVNIGAGLGRTVGPNLFQSFSEFNIQTGQTATFSGPAGVANVISRVTGTTSSGIDGTLRSTIPGADVYLINPNGVVFGPNAHLDVKGSFAASSANKVRLKDGGVYNASQPQASKLTSAPPAAFGFLGSAPKAVIVNGSQLSVPAGKAVTLVGGPVSVKGGAKVSAPAGRINVVSAASPGEAAFDFSQPAAPVDTSTLATLGPIRLTGNSSLDTSDGGTAVDAEGRGGGSIWMRAGTLSLDGSSLLSKVAGSADGRSIDIRVTGTLSLTNLAAIDAGTTAGGRGGEVNISAGTLSADGENAKGTVDTRIVTQTTGSGAAGNLTLSAGSATLSDGAFLDTGTESAGAGGNLTVNIGGSLRLLLGGVIENTARTGSTGPSGDLSVTARSITLSGADALESYSVIATRNVGSGQSGVLSVQADTITIGGDATISASTYGPANGGSATVNASTSIQIFDNGTMASNSYAAGSSGTLSIRTGTLSVAGAIESNANAQGDGGDLEIQANQMTVSPTGQVLVQVAGSGSGSGGRLDISAGSLLVDGGAISADTYAAAGFGQGRGGIIGIQASNSVTVQGTGQISASTFGTGDAGDVRISTRDLLVSGGAVDPTDPTSVIASTISAETEQGSTGRGGSVQINASGTVQVQDLGQIDASTSGTNSGGAVSIAAVGGVQVLSGGSISSDTDGSGRGGYVRIVTPNLLVSGEQTDPSNPTGTINSSISTDAFDQGSGGRVIIQSTGNVSVLASGYISADTDATGNGGSVTITAAKVLVSGTAPDGDTFDQSYISADSIGYGTYVTTGHGGDVRINASDSVQVLAAGSISADSYSLGSGGSVVVNSPTVLVSGFYQNPKHSSDYSASEISVSSLGQSGAGELVINGENLTVSNTATVTVVTSGSGAAGDMDLTLSNSVSVLSGGSVAAESTSSGRAGSINIRTTNLLVSGSERTFDDTSEIDDASGTSPRGNGSITIRANGMTLSNGGFVSAETFGPSDAGTIRLSLADSLQIVSGGGIFGDSEGKGRAANISISAPQVEVSGDSSTIASDAEDLGAAGRISIRGDQLVVGDGGEIATLAEGKALAASAPASLSLDFSGPVQIFSNGVVTATTTGAAPGGDLTLTAGSLSLDGSGSLLTARSLGTSARAGVAGRLSVTVSGDLTVSEHGLISTQAVNAAGGSISLTTGGNLRLTGGSAINAQSVGGGGNVDLNVNGTLFALDSGITASTVGATAQGGTVTIGDGTRFLILNETAITAKAEQGLGGNIVNDADFTFATADRALAIPPAPAFDPNGLINPFDTASASGNLGTVVSRTPDSSLASTLGEVTYRAPDLVVVNQYPASEKQLAEAKAAAAQYLDARSGRTSAPALPPAPGSKVAGSTAAGTHQPAARPVAVPERHAAGRTGVPVGTPRPERAAPSVVPSRVIAVQVSKKSDTSPDTIGIILVDPVSRRVASPDVYEISRRQLESGDSVTIEGQSATLVARDL